MERHSEPFLASPHLADAAGTAKKRVHFNDRAQRSNDAISQGSDTGGNSLEPESRGKMAANQSKKLPGSDQLSVPPLCFKQSDPEPRREPPPSVVPPARAEPPASTKSTSTQSSNDSRSSGGADAYARLRPLVSRIRGIHHQEVHELVDEMKGENAQAMADVLSTVLSQEKGILATDEGNRILVVLCKLAAHAKVYPQRYALKDVKYNRNSMKPGGFAIVYEGQHQNRAVCIKIISHCDDKLLSAYTKELMLWAHLSHPNILPFYGVYQDSETLKICLVSPRMRKGTLAEYVLKWPQEPRMPLISGVIDGLLYLHGLHIVHSDIKGENVLISDEGRPLIMDFGISHIATATAGQRYTTSLIGRSLHWTAPEMIDDEESIRPTKPSDVWSFACLCYEVLSRRIPFHTFRDAQVMRALLANKKPPRPEPGHNDWDEIDDHMWGLMTSCWCYKPEDRPTLQDIHDRFAMSVIQGNDANVLTGSGGDSTLRGSMNESPIKMDSSRPEKALPDSVKYMGSTNQLGQSLAPGSQDLCNVEQEAPPIVRQSSTSLSPVLDRGVPLSQSIPSLPDLNPAQDNPSDPSLIHIQHKESSATHIPSFTPIPSNSIPTNDGSRRKEQGIHGSAPASTRSRQEEQVTRNRTAPPPFSVVGPLVRSPSPQVAAKTSESVRSPTIINAIKAIRNDDIVIAFMGPTGSGKSYFIDLLAGQLGRRAGNALKSVTSQIQATRVQHRLYGDRIVLIDTPGFDDTARSDMEILIMISDWLQKTYERDVKLSGLIYLHRITDNRMSGTPLKNLRMFGELCGDVAMNQVILVSNMWQKVKPEVGVAREEELKSKFWKPLVERGSRVDRLMDARGSEAWRIIEQLIRHKDKREAVLLQEELVELQKKLNETQAGKTLYTTLQKALDDQRESLRSLVAQVEKSNDPALTRELRREYEKILKEFQRTFGEVKKLKIPLGKRIMNFFFGKRARAKAVKVKDNL